MIPVCRYGQTWADWREVSHGWRGLGPSSGDRTESLTLEEGEWVTALTGQSFDITGGTRYLSVTTSTGRMWQKGCQSEASFYSLRPSPALEGRLSHLSGCGTRQDWVLCCHWTCG